MVVSTFPELINNFLNEGLKYLLSGSCFVNKIERSSYHDCQLPTGMIYKCFFLNLA